MHGAVTFITAIGRRRTNASRIRSVEEFRRRNLSRSRLLLKRLVHQIVEVVHDVLAELPVDDETALVLVAEARPR